MQLKDEVSNKELSKRLCELGVKQESYFYWIESEDEPIPSTGYEYQQGGYEGLAETAAFTVAELGNILAPHLHNLKDSLDEFCFRNDTFYLRMFSADYWAKMLIYLLENGLLTLEQEAA